MEATREVADETSVKSKRAKGKKTSSGHAELARTRSNSVTDLPTKQPAVNEKQGSFRSQNQTMSCSSFFATTSTSPYLQDRVLTENAKDLTPEQMRALELDIFKPLDFYEILFGKMNVEDSQRGEEKEPGRFTVIEWQDFILKDFITE